ncbi:MAG: hypothetical protein ABI969_17370 [bacterium]
MRLNAPLLLLALVVAVPSNTRAQAQSASAPAARPKPAQLPRDSMELGRKYAVWVYTVQADSVVAHMDSASRAEPEAARNIEDISAQVALDGGSEERVLEEKFITRNGKRQYWRTAKFSSSADPMVIRIVMSAKGEFMGMGMNPVGHTPPIDP